MKIAVYSIAKNEAKHVERWQRSACDADGLFILDTGSTDGTVTVARDNGVTVECWNPGDQWRFDKARNRSLWMVPEDYDMCISLDLDEVLAPGWRDELERLHGVTRPRYRYTWSWNGLQPGLVYGGDKIHSRRGYYWKHPVHEVLTPMDGFNEVQGWCGLEIHHHPDPVKSRSQYLPLLELAVEEDPMGDRNLHYLGREYFFADRHRDAMHMFKRHLEVATWGPERAQSYRYMYKMTKNNYYLHRAIQEAPDRREGYTDLAYHHYEQKEWEQCLAAATAALKIKERPLEYLTEEHAWGTLLHDIAGIAAYQLGYYHEAKYHGLQAVKMDPYDARLVDNLRHYREAAA